jgi:hypothetical protein
MRGDADRSADASTDTDPHAESHYRSNGNADEPADFEPHCSADPTHIRTDSVPDAISNSNADPFSAGASVGVWIRLL